MCLPVTRLEYSISFRTADWEEGRWEVVQVGGGQQRKKEQIEKVSVLSKFYSLLGGPPRG